MMTVRRIPCAAVACAAVFGLSSVCFADAGGAPDPTSVVADHGQAIDIAWVLVAAFLVFFMQAGFGILETGLVRAKNACNILMKNFMDFSLACLGFFVVGFGLMYGDGNGFAGTSGWCLQGITESGGLPVSVFWLFQAVFCGTAATIVSGCVAERIRFHAYLVCSLLISVAVYPVVGHWVWGGGWLSSLGFQDFAGSGVVHALGGFAGLVGTIMLGPRLGKYGPDGRPRVLAGHNIPLAALGVFILWFGWYGFNPGSTLGLTAGNAVIAGNVAANTTLAAAAGALAAMVTVWLKFGKPDLTMTMNGVLAGLVAITAPCAVVTPVAAILIGLVGGVLVVLGVILLDRLRIDDPVGAWSVHGLNGVWGVLSIGLFGSEIGLLAGGGLRQLGIQALGIAAIVAWTVVLMVVVFGAIKALVGLRVGPDEELRGLDIGEHGQEPYAGFEIFVTT